MLTVRKYIQNELAAISQVRGKKAIKRKIKKVRKKLKENDSTLSGYVQGSLKRALLNSSTETELLEYVEYISRMASTYNSHGEKSYEEAVAVHEYIMWFG